MRNILFSLLSTLLAISVLSAQWSSDSLQNTEIIVHEGDQIVPKIKATSDGGCYISWYDNRDGNYAMYLQRLNPQGERIWDANGLLISDHPQESWITDYDLAVDQNDNAILVFNDIRNGSDNGWDIFAYKISPSGDFLWGPDGVGLSPASNTESEMSPKVVVTTEGNYVFAWTRSGAEDVVALQKLSSEGQKLWGNDGLTITGQQESNSSHPHLVAALDDSVIVLWKETVGSYPNTKTFLFLQKLTPNGQFVWGTDGINIYNQGDIVSYYDPVLCSDDNSGAFVGWEERPTNSESYVEIGHVLADGSLGYPLNGIKTSITSARMHWRPTLTFNPSLQTLFIFWLETNSDQNEYGIYGQKMDLEGNRLWGDEGKAFLTLDGRSISFVSSAATDTSIYVGYFRSSASNSADNGVQCFLSDNDGNFIWQPVILSAASLGNKDDLGLSLNLRGQALFTWSDMRNENNDIYAQNINPDGTLGILTSGIAEPLLSPPTEMAVLQNFPNPFNANTTIAYRISGQAGKPVHVRLTLYNSAGQDIRTLVDAYLRPGQYRYLLHAEDLSSGVYFYALESKGQIRTRKMLLLK